jgi:hypothetical protein
MGREEWDFFPENMDGVGEDGFKAMGEGILARRPDYEQAGLVRRRL